MFCRFCGGNIAEDSTFCQVCGKQLDGAVGSQRGVGAAASSISTSYPATQKSAGSLQNSLWVGALVLLVGMLTLWAVKQLDTSRTSTANQQQTLPLPPSQLHRITIGGGALTVKASGYSYYTLTVPPGAKSVSLQGRFTATGGFRNDIEVYLLSDTEYINWQNGHSTAALYNSGKVTVADVNAVLPNDAGTYYLIFNNRFSLFSPKAVQENLNLTYYQ